MKLKSIIFLAVMLLIVTPWSFGNNILAGTLKPTMIEVYNDSLFVVDMNLIRVYDLKNLELINTFGEKGEGPGQYQIDLQMPLKIKAFPEYVIVESINKILYFSHQGEFLKESKKPMMLNFIQPAGENYIGRRFVQPHDGSELTSNIQIYNGKFDLIKDLYKHKFIRHNLE